MEDKLLIITRCSRFDFLEKMYNNISIVMNDSVIDYRWHIIFDMNRNNKIQPNIIKLIEQWKQSMDIITSFGSSNDDLYGSNLATQALCNSKNIDFTHVYLLDDDNCLHDNFKSVILQLESDKIVIFNQLRRNPLSKQIDTLIIDETLNSENALGWIDSAQFIIPTSLLSKGYENGYCIDGLTIKSLLEIGVQYKLIDLTAAYYNYFTEIIYNY